MHLINEQLKIGYNVRAFYFRQKGTGLPNAEMNYVDGCNPYNNLDRFIFYSKELKITKVFFEKYAQYSFDLIHAHTLFVSGYIAYLIKRKENIPYIVAVRGTDINIFFKYRFFLRREGIKIMKNAEKIIFISPLQKKQVLDKYIPASMLEEISNKIVVIPNGIDELWFQNTSDCHNESITEVKAIYFGDVNRNKNLVMMIRAMDLLEKEYKAIKFTVIGKIYDKSLKKLISSRSYIEYHNEMPQSQLISYVRQSNVFIMPSKSETFGLSYVEAMSQGVPVIYTKGQGFDGYFEDGYIGKHVNPLNHHEIAAAVKFILNNYEYMRVNCINASRRFVWSEIAKQYKDIYDDIWCGKDDKN